MEIQGGGLLLHLRGPCGRGSKDRCARSKSGGGVRASLDGVGRLIAEFDKTCILKTGVKL